MAAFKKFEDIESWQLAKELSNTIFKIYSTSDLMNDFKLWDQVNGSSGSIMDNIAEGFDRGSNKEFIQFLFIAKGSSGELRSQLYRMKNRGYIDEHLFDSLYADSIQIKTKISGLINYLKNSDIKGYKFADPEEDYG